MSNRARFAIITTCAIALLSMPSKADDISDIGQVMTQMRAMIGKPLQDQSINFSNTSPFVLGTLGPEGARFFYGGSGKVPGETADLMRQMHRFVVLLTPCRSDLSAKVESVTLWATISSSASATDSNNRIPEVLQNFGLSMEQLLSMMNSPPAVGTPGTLRASQAKNLRGPVFVYNQGDITQTISFLNEGPALRVNWKMENTAICPR